MPKLRNAAGIAALGLLLGASALCAQTTLVGTRVLDEKIDDINRDAQLDIERAEDAARFGNEQFAPGMTGSLSASYNGTTGNTSTQDFTLAGRMNLNAGDWNHSIGAALEFGEAASVKNKEKAFVILDSSYDLGPQYYVFALGRFQYDTYGPYRQDAFLGVGPGIRLVNNEQVAWRVQAGPGARYTKVAGMKSDTQTAGILSSRFFYRITPSTFVTNDTDALASKNGTLYTNDLGINFAVTDVVSTRLSLQTQYNTDATVGTKQTDNTVGVSLVYSFN